MAPDAKNNLFGAMLRNWRKARNLSQLELALRAGSSQRNLSFVESGRTRPSREMVLKLAEALDLPLRARNEILLAAGFAPFYEERSLKQPAMTIVNEMLRRMLQHHEPYPGLVLDGGWNVVMHNAAAGRVINGCVAPEALREISSEGSLNFLRLMCDPIGIRPHVRNWPQVGSALLARVRREAVAYPGSQSEVLLRELLGEGLLPSFTVTDSALEPVISVDLEIEGSVLRLFNALTTLGAPQDITLQEVRIEMSFPADEATADLLRRWGNPKLRAKPGRPDIGQKA
jgi:transcriptional regulator with XRE-family HTH domain